MTLANVLRKLSVHDRAPEALGELTTHGTIHSAEGYIAEDAPAGTVVAAVELDADAARELAADPGTTEFAVVADDC